MLIFRDDFKHDSRSDYRLNGHVSWRHDRIVLMGRAVITRAVAAGPRLEVTVRLWNEDSEPTDSPLTFQLALSMAEGQVAAVDVIGPTASNPEGRLRLIGNFYGTMQTVREFTLRLLPSSEWRISFNYGVIEVLLGEDAVAMGYADTGYNAPSYISIGTISEALSCDFLEVTSHVPPVLLNATQLTLLPTIDKVAEQATLAHLHGQTREALTLEYEALRLTREAYGEHSPQVSGRLNRIGTHLCELGDYRRARRYLERAIQASERLFGEYHPHTAAALSGLATLLVAQRDFAAATAYYQRILHITETVLGRQHPITAKAYGYLGSILSDLGALDEALPYLRAQVEAREEMFGRTDRHIAPALIQFALALADLGRVTEGRQHAERALAIYEDSLESNNIELARARDVVGRILTKEGHFSEARDHFQRALMVCKTVLGPQHRNTAILKRNIARAHYGLGHVSDAYSSLRDALEIQTRIATEILPTLSDAEALAYVGTIRSYRDELLTVARSVPNLSPQELYGHVLESRGLLERLLSRQAIVSEAQTVDEGLSRRLQAVRSSIAALTYHVPKAEYSAEREVQLADLVQEKEGIERQLRTKGARSRPNATSSVTPGMVLSNLPDAVALVEIVEALYGERRYEAFVLKNGANGENRTISWITLGPASRIDAAVVEWRECLGNPRIPSAQTNRAGLKIRQLVWENIEPYIDEASIVLIVPDGALTRVPWAAIPGKDPGTYLIQSLSIATVGNAGQIIASLKSRPQEAESIVLVGGVDYDKRDSPSPGGIATTNRPIDPEVRRGLMWRFLPGTLDEVGRIAKLETSPKVSILTGAKATEGRVRSFAESARYVHLATHGFFADAKFRSVFQATNGERLSFSGFASFGPGSTVTGRNPLLLSGLVVAGANAPNMIEPGEEGAVDDGLLTAEEVVDLNLGETDLVVLSACETGLGEVAGGEGVFGLQRAFGLAGARTVIASLWKVHDAVTSALMEEFYRNLWQRKMGKLEALRGAQLKMLSRLDQKTGLQPRGKGAARPASSRAMTRDDMHEPPDDSRTAPFYWAAFVLSGDWR